MEGTCNNRSHFQTIFLILVVFTSSSFTESVSAARPVAGDTNTEFIRTSCKSTTYPNLCFSSLSSRATAIGVSPQLLAHESLTVSLETAQSTSVTMVELAHGQGMTPREIGAMHDCVEELSDAVVELRKSLGEMKQLRGKDFDLKMSDIQTWVSAALTDEDTCTEGFAGKVMNGKVKTVVRGRILDVAHMTSNALALINSLAAFHG
ncbi:21 kDa protein-like precursor [Nicotiana tabacum]|uniref:21 kDa protein-like n=1 Tax=Nicotiana tabacum TaxID=4097 RepID=Q9LW90_TOBAC|nr:21 kDa protein-like precursor [Nicotiana tabacum]XP_009597893.1 21 kDa protein-like [Nicotiana tomentosiformis]BAA95794.1 DC1.2 homologue [Nicotiana tabacum]